MKRGISVLNDNMKEFALKMDDFSEELKEKIEAVEENVWERMGIIEGKYL